MRYCLRETAKAPRRPPALAPVEHPRTSLDMSSAVPVERVAHWQPTSRRFLDYFIVMQALGGILLAILFLTAATGRVRRYATWLSFCVAWLVSCLSYVMLSFFGRQYGVEPGYKLCLSQAVLIYGAPVLCAFATFSLVIQLCITTRLSVIFGPTETPRATVFWLVAIPWFIYILVLAEALSFGLAAPSSVHRLDSSVYCAIASGMPGAISGTLVAIAILCSMVAEGLIAHSLLRHWRTASPASPTSSRLGSWSLLIRIGVLTLFEIGALGASISFALQVTNPAPNGMIATMPLATFVVFGSQRDVLQAWSFWRRKDGQRGKYVPPPEQRLKHTEDVWKVSNPERALHGGLRA